VIKTAATDVWILQQGKDISKVTGRDARGRKQYSIPRAGGKREDDGQVRQHALRCPGIAEIRCARETFIGESKVCPAKKCWPAIVRLLETTF